MRLTTVPGTLIERLLLVSGRAPTPLMDTIVALLLARTIMAATKLGLFEALGSGPASPAEVADRCGTELRATETLLFTLAGTGYLREGSGRYRLAPIAARWLLKDCPRSLHDAVLHRYLDGAILEHAEEFVRTGRPANIHETMTPGQWDLYQRGQRSHAVYSAAEVARRTPVPRNPRAMLDLGGAHGYYSVALCRRYPGLRSTILDLPEAVEHSAPILAQEGLGDRVVHRAGNALTDDLGVEQFDLVFLANLVHHFDAASNRDLARRVARALKPGGFCVILEIIRPGSPREAGQVGALLNFHFSVSSASGTWTFAEMASWQRDAGLIVRKPIRLRMTPGYGLQAARKP